ncbi:MAG: class I SAM-dependent methyltransferase [Armatimonadota bacterium]|nr:class I SAM-dependent methyltransferase [Armatimonadota bacterium]
MSKEFDSARELTKPETWDQAWRKYRGMGSRRLAVRELDRYLARVLALVPESGSVVELGGAPGRIIERMHKLRPDLRYDCLDFSSTGLDRAAELYDAYGIHGDLILADLMTCEEKLGHYDLACSHGVVEHFEDVGAVVARHFAFVKPGGLVSILVPNYAGFPVAHLIRLFCKRTLETHNLECMSPKVLERAAERSGGIVLEAGYAGAAILPCSGTNNSLAGQVYGLTARIWNLLNSFSGLVSGDRLVARFWRHQVYVIARKQTEQNGL